MLFWVKLNLGFLVAFGWMILLTISLDEFFHPMSAFLGWKIAENLVLSFRALCRQLTVPEWQFLYRRFPEVQKHILYLSGPNMSQQCISPFRLGLYWASQTSVVTVPLTPQGKLSCQASKSHVSRNNCYSQRSRILPYSILPTVWAKVILWNNDEWW